MRISIVLGLLMGFLLLGEAVSAQGNGSTSPPVVYGPVHPGNVVKVIREAKPLLEAVNCCSYGLGFLVSRYHHGSLTIELVALEEGKEWYRVSYGGVVVVAIIDEL